MITALYIAYDPIKKLGGINNKIKEALASLQRLNEILNTDETVVDVEEPLVLSEIKKAYNLKLFPLLMKFRQKTLKKYPH